MTRRARQILLLQAIPAGALLVVAASSVSREPTHVWLMFAVLTAAASASVAFYRHAPSEIVCSPLTVFVVAAVVSLPPFLVIVFFALPSVADYVMRRPPWWAAAYNASNQFFSALSAWYLGHAIATIGSGGALATLASAVSAFVYVALNVSLISVFHAARHEISLRLARLDRESAEGELLSASLGVACAAVIYSAPWATPFVFASVIALPRAFSLPLLRRDARDRERELGREQLANERLRELDTLKREFVEVIQHELRGPIGSIAGYTETVLDGPDPLTDEQRFHVGVVQRNSERLSRLVDDLALMDEVEHELTVEFAVVDLRQIAGDAVAAAQPQAATKQIELHFVASGDGAVHGDAGRLGQVVDNLISNAIKYTPDGGAVEVRLAKSDSHVRLDVTDNGPGISAIDQERLFDRFFRTASAKRNRTPGSGLGLAIVKAIIDKHDGAVAVSGVEGEGTVFTVTLGATSADSSGAIQRPEPDQAVIPA